MFAAPAHLLACCLPIPLRTALVMRVSSLLLACTLLACLLSAASADLCSQHNTDCGDCTQQLGCGWCAGYEDSNGNHLSTCQAGTSAGPLPPNICATKSGSTWRFGQSETGTIVVGDKQSTQLPTGLEALAARVGTSEPACGSNTCDWACNLVCGSTESCSYDRVSGTNTYNCSCHRNPFKWLGLSHALMLIASDLSRDRSSG